VSGIGASRLTQPARRVKPLCRPTKTLLSLPGWGLRAFREVFAGVVSDDGLQAAASRLGRNDQGFRDAHAAKGSNRA
jgi:hypothetical protein